MCGIAGLWNFDRDTLETSALRMVRAMRHRGPEGDGIASGDHWVLGHARLAIIDVDGGAQPLWNEDGTLAIVGNNEIYNAECLRAELGQLGHSFRTRSDTEVVLHAYEQWGTAAFRRLNGMFAVAIADTRSGRGILARDPLGIKPLHYWTDGTRVAFASEIKALREVPGIGQRPNWDAVHLFMNLRYVPDDRTLFEGVDRLPPGSFAELTPRGLHVRPYYRWETLQAPSGIRPETAAEGVRELLPKAVERHLISDVEVGSYLSGGIDSSLVSLFAAKRVKGLRTYCLGFGDKTDENVAARSFAGAIGARHQDLSLPDNALDRFEEVLWHVEEPKVNCLQGFALAEKVSRDVKVVLSGLGGDELFAGYVNNDLLTPTVWSARLRNTESPKSLSFLQKLWSRPRADHPMRAMELGLNVFDPLSYYLILRNGFDHNAHLMKSLYAKAPEHWRGLTYESLRPYYRRENPDTLNELLLLEMRTKLINDFLLTEDRVSMAHSLEVRVPFLDRELLEWVVPLPSGFKYRPGQKKRMLKRVARDWLPEATLNAPKWGFSVTPHSFYRRGLKPFLEKTLTPESVGNLGLFSWKWIDQVMHAPPTPRLRWHHFNLWVMAGITVWHRRFFEGAHAPA